MRTDVIPSYPGRPAVVEHEGWAVFVSVHDAYHYRERKRLRAAITQAHPDYGGSREKLTKAIERWQDFIGQERVWYHVHKVKPPTRLDERIDATGLPRPMAEGVGAVLKMIHAKPGLTTPEMLAQPGAPETEAKLRGVLFRLLRDKWIFTQYVDSVCRYRVYGYWPAKANTLE